MASDRAIRPVGRRTALRLGGAGALAGGAALAAGAGGVAAAPDQQLDGIWRSVFTRAQPAPNTVLNQRILTCMADGTALLGGPPVNPDAGRLIFRDIGYGEWLRTGDQQFAVSVVLTTYSEDGGALFETTVVLDVSLNAALDSLSGTYASTDRDFDGAVRGTRAGTVTAERMRLSA